MPAITSVLAVACSAGAGAGWRSWERLAVDRLARRQRREIADVDAGLVDRLDFLADVVGRARLMASRSLLRMSEAIAFTSSADAPGATSGAASSGFLVIQSAAAL